jgi:hypothetical protein
MTFRERMHNIGMALCGPAPSGPYGPPVAPPTPRLRDNKGRLLKGKKLAEFNRLADIARSAAADRLETARQFIDSAYDGPGFSAL